MARKGWLDALCFLLCVIIQARVSRGTDLYISRASGNDSWSCDQKTPCKTIWRAVTLASRGDHIHLDGTNTEEDPYTCQSAILLHPGIYINKSLSLIGLGPMPPHIRCSDGNNLTFDGSDNAEQMVITLTGLLLNESFVYFQDLSVNIDSCTFERSKRGVQFLISTRMVSAIQITNSSFRKNKECISVVVNSSKSQSQIIQVIFKLINSSFYGNSMSDKGSCMSFSESSKNNQSASCNITVDNVAFSHNKFSSRGLLFLELDGNQNIDLQNLTFTNNNPASGRDYLAGDSLSECIVRSNLVNIIINASNFTSQNARLVNVNASQISLQIYNSSFRGHKVEGNGGVMSIRGTDFCKFNVSNSSFINTTAGEGGAFNVKCSKVIFNLQENSFTGNMAMNGSGGAVYVGALGFFSKDSEYAMYYRDKVDRYSNQTEQRLEINIEKCGFTNAYSLRGGGGAGGGVYINTQKTSVQPCDRKWTSCSSARDKKALNAGAGGSLGVVSNREMKMNVNNSFFISNYAFYGGSLAIYPLNWDDRMLNGEITIQNSIFSNNSAEMGGAIFLKGNNKSVLVLENVTMDSNRANRYGGAAVIGIFFALKIYQSRILNNTIKNGGGGVVYMLDFHILEVKGSLFDSNGVWSDNPVNEDAIAGGALSVIAYNLTSISISIINTTFNNNSCSALSGGAIYISLVLDDIRDPGCFKETFTSAHQNSEAKKYPSWNYKSHVVIEDTTFKKNAALRGGAVYLNNGKAKFRNCYFVDNFAEFKGSHIYTAAGSASVMIQDSRFVQTREELHMNYSKASFINVESSGALNISNTTMDARTYGSANPLMVVANGGLVDVGSENLTEFYCPIGSQMEIVHFTEQVMTQVNNTQCKIEVTALQFSCSTCKGNSYSLQRGRALGSQLVQGFQCLPCPFGANCTQNIFAKMNFWGFKENINPPTLRFTMCPESYCSPPRETNLLKYNGCQGNRSNELCGNCSDGYTETLYSTHCRPTHQCKDYWFWPVALIYVFLMAIYFTFKPPIVPWIKRQILWFKENKLEDQDNNYDKGYLKILFHFYQAANLLLVSNSSEYLIKANLIEPIVGLFNFKLLSSRLICPFPGLTVVTKQLFSASHVFGTLLLICVSYFLHLRIQKFRGQGVPSVGPYVGGILQTLLLGYTTLATVSFSLLRCVPIGSERRLFYDGNVVCFKWWQYILISFVCAFVVPFVFVLLWGSFKLYGGTLSVGKFMLACFFPLPALIYWLFVFFSHVTGYPVNGHSTPCQVSRNYLESVLYDSFNRPEDGRKLSLSWESIMIGRRLILVVLKSFVSDPSPRLLIMGHFCFLFLLHHVVAQPFRDGIANTVETISLLSIAVLASLNAFFASFLSLSVPLDADHFSSWWNVFQGVEIAILCFVPAVFGLLVVTAILSQLCRLAVVICRVVCYFCWICYRLCYCNQDDEARPLLAPAS
ncbi:hypothetical protein ACROYT_G021989 [Oculina patagonica]